MIILIWNSILKDIRNDDVIYYRIYNKEANIEKVKVVRNLCILYMAALFV